MELEVGVSVAGYDIVTFKPMAIFEEISVTVDIQDKPVIVKFTVSTYVGDELLTHLFESSLERQEELAQNYPHQWHLLLRNTLEAIIEYGTDVPIWYVSQEAIRIYCTCREVLTKDKVSLSELIINFERNHYPIRARRVVRSWMTA